MQTFEHFAGLKDEAKLADISCRMRRRHRDGGVHLTEAGQQIYGIDHRMC